MKKGRMIRRHSIVAVSVLSVLAFFIGCVGKIQSPVTGYPDLPQGVTMLDKTTFSALTAVPGRITMVDFYRPTCPPCMIMDSVVKRLGERYSDKALIGKVNVQEDDTLQYADSIRWTPTFLFLDGGKEIRRTIGVQKEDALAAVLDSLLGSPIGGKVFP